MDSMSTAVPARGAPSPRLARLRFFKLPRGTHDPELFSGRNSLQIANMARDALYLDIPDDEIVFGSPVALIRSDIYAHELLWAV